MNGGTLQIYAAAPTVTWTLLTATAEYDTTKPEGQGGASTITVLDNVSSWTVGSSIIVASTDFNADLSEVRTIQSVSADGKTITLDKPLNWQHYGKIWSWPGGRDYVDERAEIGLLTRSFKIHGDITDGESNLPWNGLGSQIFINAGSSVQISGVEFFACGQRGQLARYPIHFHMSGDMQGSIVEKCSFHDTFQRCLTVHGTNYLNIQDNVAYNSTGHCYFIEDGTERYNKFIHNLGVVAKQPCCPDYDGKYAVGGSQWTADTRLLATDSEPSIFWITHPHNDFINNSAVGGQFGYWYSLPAAPIGVSYQDPLTNKQLIFPRVTQAGTFYGNKAHSCNEDGLFIDRGITENPPCPTGTKDQCGDAPDNTGYGPRMGAIDVDPTIPLTSAQISDLLNNQPYAYSIFEEFTAHHCRSVGMWGRGNAMIGLSCHLADNQISAQFPGDGNLMIDSVFVAETDNVGNPGRDGGQDARSVEGRTRPVRYWPEAPLIGYRTYDAGGPDLGFNNRFYNFQMFFFEFDFKIRYAGAFSGQGGPNVITPRTKFYNNTFFNTSDYSRVYVYRSTDRAFKGWAMADVDGTLTGGMKDFTGGCGSWIVSGNNNSVILAASGCQYVWGWNAHLCRPTPGSTPVRAHNIAAYDRDTPLPTFNDWGPGVTLFGTWLRLSDGANCTQSPRVVSDLPASSVYPEGGNSVQLDYPNNIRTGEEYFFQFGQGNTQGKFSVSMGSMESGLSETGTLSTPEWIRFAFPYPTGTTYAIIGDDNTNCTQVGSRAALTYNTYFVEPSATAGVDLLWIHMQPDGLYWTYYRYGLMFNNVGVNFRITANCPNSVCTVPYPVAAPLASTVLPPRYTVNVCENGARNQAGGTMSYTASGSSLVVFDDDFRNGWAVPSWNGGWQLSSALPANEQPPGVQGVSIVTSWTPYASIRFTLNGGVAVAGLTHLRFDVRNSAATAGPLDLAVSFSDTDGKNIGQDIRVNNPWSLAGSTVPDDTKWTTVYLSIANALIADPATSTKKIAQIAIYNAQGRNTSVYIDNVSLGAYTTNLVSVSAPNPTTASTVTGDFGTGSGPAGRPLNGFVPPTGSAPIVRAASASTVVASMVAVLLGLIFVALF